MSAAGAKTGAGVSGALDSAGRSIKGAAHTVGGKVSHAADKVRSECLVHSGACGVGLVRRVMLCCSPIVLHISGLAAPPSSHTRCGLLRLTQPTYCPLLL